MPDIIPQVALDYIKNKNLKVGFSYKDVWNEEHATSFTVAKAMQLDVLSDLHNAVTKAIEQGQSFDTFKKNLKPTLQQKGWWGRKEMEDPLTGRTVDAQLGSDRRLKTIYSTNLRSAYQKGQYDRTMASDMHPYLMYLIGASVNHREEHLSWNGLILPKDDPWWDSHFPPNGWGCQCHTRAVSEYRLQKYKAEGIPVPVAADGSGGGTLRVKTEAPPDGVHYFYNERKGLLEEVPNGVDPAFNWNQGKAARDAGAKAALEKASQNYEKAAAEKPKKEGDKSSAISVKLSQDMQKLIDSENVELSNMSDEVGKEVYSKIDSFYNEFPAMKGLVTSIDENEKVGIMSMSSSGELHINKVFFDRPLKEIEEIWKINTDGDQSRGIEKGFHPPNTTWLSAIDHEIGHAIAAHITRLDRANPDRDYNWTPKDMIDPILESFGIDPLDRKAVRAYVKMNLALYPLKKRGAKFYNEILAEAFQEYRSPNPRPFAVALGKAIKPYLSVKINYTKG